MGSKRSRVARFLEKHPVCCYCGGMTPASTEDHWPSRAIFDDRKWPDGYVFPACGSCNKATADDEALFALLCRMSRSSTDKKSSEQTLQLLKAIDERTPEIGKTFRRPARLPEGALYVPTRVGRPTGAMDERPVVISIDHPDIREKVSRCAAKLLLSLHYLHTNRIVPRQGGAVWSWLSNGSLLQDAWLESGLSKLLQDAPTIKWQKFDLNDQFAYEFGAHGDDSNGFACALKVRLHRTMYLQGIVFDDLGRLKDELPADRLLQPFPSGACSSV